MHSIVSQRGNVAFPAHIGERVYMHEFFKGTGLPAALARWQPIVNSMLDGVETTLPIYLMVDQGMVKAGDTHRRPGVHVDGYWNPGKGKHGWRNRIGAHGGSGHGQHRRDRGYSGGHGSRPPTHLRKGYGEEALFLATDVSACRAYSGEWEGMAGEGGDCSHINVSALHQVMFESNKVYAGNVAMLHESLPVKADTLRTVVRLNVPGYIVH